MLIDYANMHPNTTLFMSQESTNEELRTREHSSLVDYRDSFEAIDFTKYETLCIENLEVFAKEDLKQFLMKAMEKEKRIVLASHMRRNGKVSDLLEELCV